MNEHLNLIQSEVQARELQRQAELRRLGRGDASTPQTAAASQASSTLVIRVARSDDEAAIDRLAHIDGRRIEGSELLIAEVEGEVLAALPLTGGEAVADPFRPTAELVQMLRLRAGQLRDGAAPRRGLAARLARALRIGEQRPAMAPATPGNARLLIPPD